MFIEKLNNFYILEKLFKRRRINMKGFKIYYMAKQ